MATEDVVRIVKAEIERLESVLKLLAANPSAVIEPATEAPAASAIEVPVVVPKKLGRPLGAKSAPPATSVVPSTAKPKRKMSPEGHARFLAARQKWQAERKKQAKTQAALKTMAAAVSPKSRISPEGRARLKASTEARWAAIRKAGAKGGKLVKVKP